MKYIPGTEFAIKKNVRDFEEGTSYRIHHISPIKEGVEYTFFTQHGKVLMDFDSIDTAETLINKYSDIAERQ